MARGTTRKKTNELEFQGEVLNWLNTELSSRALGLDRATQEKPRLTSGKRSDLVIWKDRAGEIAFLAMELKTPTTLINDPVFLADAIEKAQNWRAAYFAIWNMREFEVYQTPAAGDAITPAEAIGRSAVSSPAASVDDWLDADIRRLLAAQAVEILDTAIDHSLSGGAHNVAIDAEIFVSRITHAITKLRHIIFRDLTTAASKSRAVRRRIQRIAAEQGFLGFVENVDESISGQIGYRYIGQILFYHALRRKISSLPAISLSSTDRVPGGLQPYWNEVRRYDYEALFGPHELDDLVEIDPDGQFIIRQLISQFAEYDWASLSDDVLGSIFENLIPRTEQMLLGQFYTPNPVADLIVAFTLDGDKPFVLDPGCGSGTFLMRAYSYLSATHLQSHKELLNQIWGFDISAFAAELAVINLYRQNMSEYENFPRIVTGSFLDREPGQTVEFPAPRVSAGGPAKVKVPVPKFDAILANPPYVRSQHQDDLDPSYVSKLFMSANKAGISADSKTDLFAFFIYHSLRFMAPGARLGFVTSSSWLTADFAAALQQALLEKVRLVAIITSSVESFFTQVDVNTVLIIAEMREDGADRTGEKALFISLNQPISSLVAGATNYWARVIKLADELEAINSSIQNEKYQVKVLDVARELAALKSAPQVTRNWSRLLRAPLSYYKLFGDV